MTVWDAGRRRTLQALAAAIPGRRIVVVGAVAITHHLGAGFRGTRDLDLCVALGIDEHVRDDAWPTAWERDRSRVHRWRTEDGGLVDVLPAEDALLQAGAVAWPDGTVMDLFGIDLAMRDSSPIGHELPADIHVASLRALFVCKVAAWLDRPADRLQDLGDLAAILEAYVDESDARLFDDPRIEADRDFAERPALLLGIDLRDVVSPVHRERIDAFIARVGDPNARDHGLMLDRAPARWRREPDAVVRRLVALQAGLAG